MILAELDPGTAPDDETARAAVENLLDGAVETGVLADWGEWDLTLLACLSCARLENANRATAGDPCPFCGEPFRLAALPGAPDE